ncbi:MAG TPA: helix-turn-helix transcriptional regulator [Candidatus Enterococcus stercoravium]|nr:helix-turn-helix transcriptional regulator [Candidatus Enterococcus stercoravium]
MNELKNWRASHGLTQEEAAEKLGISYSLVAKLEQGNRVPSVTTAKMIANKMGVHWTIFFNDEITKRDKRKEVAK